MTPDIETPSAPSWKTRLQSHRSARYISRLEELLPVFSPAERLLLYGLSALLAVSAFLLVIAVSHQFSVVVPAHGGSLTEGEIGPARFINPVLALSQADNDLTQLVYSGLMRAQADGTYVPDLAQSYSISPDGTVYTFRLRPDAKFQDGTPVTSTDVAFTIELAQNPAVKSPQQADWLGVQVSAPDSQTIVFTLPHAYAPFIANTTLGILPKKLWQNVSTEELPFSPLNTHPIGSGPYKVSGFTTDSTGSPTRYDLVPFPQYVLGNPYLKRISFVFYPDTKSLIDGFNQGSVDAIAGISPNDLPKLKRKDTTLLEVPLPRTFGVFLNQSHAPVLADQSARAALSAAIDPQAIVDSVLGGYGAPLQGPLPPGVLGQAPQTTAVNSPFTLAASTSVIVSANIANAQAILQRGGWSFDQTNNVWTKKVGKNTQTLTFTISTANQPELVATAHALAQAWGAAGIPVSVQVYSLSDFNNTILRPRNYDAILFGEVVGRTADLFAFWNSSQRNDPGLNLAMYANSQADALLSQARSSEDDVTRTKLLDQFAQLVRHDQPAVFLYAPDFLYVVPNDLSGIELGALTNSSERFLNVYEWYTETSRVWDVFAPKAQ
ncbi:MAG TPA: ABC transporter substrate-binding protein [Candidatus Paceibacterota bacterium]|nr:ABC transporter substrate-binding protein [Candidatus Paceibacterota bacterium]